MPVSVLPGKVGYDDDARLVAAELANLPEAVAAALDDAGITIVACHDFVTDVEPGLSGQHPDNWPPGATWDTVPGAYLPARKAVVVATMADASGRRHVPRCGEYHGSRSLAVHETLHGFDYSENQKLSGSGAFRTAWTADKKLLGSNYYTHPKSGPRETLAESGAQHFGLDRSQYDVWPHLRDFWQAAVDHDALATLEPATAAQLEAGERPASIGFGVRQADGSFVLYLTARGPNGEIGHGMVTIAEGQAGYGQMLERFTDASRKPTIETMRGQPVFDVPPFHD